MDWFFYIVIAILGACLGSFTTAIIHRVKHQQSWIFQSKGKYARSICPLCESKLSALDLIPILSWFFLAGQCRYCGQKISAQYPLTEIAFVVLSMAAFYFLGWSTDWLFTMLILPFAFAQILLFCQKQFISLQLCFIMIAVIVLYLTVKLDIIF